MLFEYAYNSDYSNFLLHYSEESHIGFVDGCVCWGMINDSVFREHILNSNIKFPDFVYKAAYSLQIIDNIVDLHNIEKYKPFCLWYPKTPSKATCIALSNKFEFLNFSLGIVSILMGWKNVYLSLNNINDKFLYDLSQHVGVDWVSEYPTSAISLSAEVVFPDSIFTYCDVVELFSFNKLTIKNIFRPYHTGSYVYTYPLGIPYLVKNGFDYHMINKTNPFYVYNEENIYESDIDSDY